MPLSLHCVQDVRPILIEVRPILIEVKPILTDEALWRKQCSAYIVAHNDFQFGLVCACTR